MSAKIQYPAVHKIVSGRFSYLTVSGNDQNNVALSSFTEYGIQKAIIWMSKDEAQLIAESLLSFARTP